MRPDVAILNKVAHTHTHGFHNSKTLAKEYETVAAFMEPWNYSILLLGSRSISKCLTGRNLLSRGSKQI